MKITPTNLPEVLILEPQVFGDERGFFMESYNRRTFNEAVGHDVQFVQDNHSRSARGVLRGLHYQLPPHAQAKLIRVIRGSAFDVAVDIRKDSPNFGRWIGIELSATNCKQLWIPAGFAHGFLALSDETELLYKTDDYYARDLEGSILWSDPTIGISWPLPRSHEPVLSAKDLAAPRLEHSMVCAAEAWSVPTTHTDKRGRR
jgi:dTDP-4-dehydrorhamnose 3,5-epimerase